MTVATLTSTADWEQHTHYFDITHAPPMRSACRSAMFLPNAAHLTWDLKYGVWRINSVVVSGPLLDKNDEPTSVIEHVRLYLDSGDLLPDWVYNLIRTTKPEGKTTADD